MSGANTGGFPIPVELLPQIVDVEVHRVGLSAAWTVPDGVEEYRTREHLPRTLNEGCKECELLGGQVDALSLSTDLVANRIERHVAGREDLLLRFLFGRPPGQR